MFTVQVFRDGRWVAYGPPLFTRRFAGSIATYVEYTRGFPARVIVAQR